jgi:hypothetical protein
VTLNARDANDLARRINDKGTTWVDLQIQQAAERGEFVIYLRGLEEDDADYLCKMYVTSGFDARKHFVMTGERIDGKPCNVLISWETEVIA